MNKATDETLLARYREGSTDAFNALYQRHEGALYRYILRMVQQAHLANDLFQEVWMSLIKSSEAFTQDRPFAPWLYTVARNRVIDHLRLPKNGVLASADPEQVAAGSEDDEGELTLAAPDPAEHLHQRRMAEAFVSCVDALPAVQREAFVLQAESGLSIEEIAGMTHSQVETVRSRLRYARNALRKQMEAWR